MKTVTELVRRSTAQYTMADDIMVSLSCFMDNDGKQ